METDVVETGKGGPVDVFNGVVRNQKVFLPPHEHVVRLLQFFVVETIRVEILRILTES